MADYRTIPAAELGKGSNIKVELCETEVDLYWKMAIEVLELIQENNAKGEKTVMIVPYGPLGPYARLVELINKHRVSLKNCWFINMDEYLDENKQYLPKTDPLSFRGGMDRIFYGLVDPELLMPEEQRIFPEPGNEGRIWETIQKLGKLDMCWGGVGITGHIAFNEPPEPGVHGRGIPPAPHPCAEAGTGDQDHQRVHECGRRSGRHSRLVHHRRHEGNFPCPEGSHVHAP